MKNIKTPFLALILWMWTSNTLLSQEIVTDIDGNTYPVVNIGNQQWMGSNLITTSFANGEPINQLNAQSLTPSGWTWYNQDEELGSHYGKLYTWDVASSEQNLCPGGWRLPTLEDWLLLARFIDPEMWGNNNFAATELKSRRQQNSPHGEPWETNQHPRWDASLTRFGNDTYGFGALPGGIFTSQSGYSNLGQYGYFWTSTPSGEEFAWATIMLHTHKGLNHSAYPAGAAMSVRCIKSDGEQPETYNLILLPEPEQGGSVTGTGNYTQGQQVELRATPSDGWSFDGWYSLQDELVSTQNSYTLTMPGQNFTLRALFSSDDAPFVINNFPWTESFESATFPPQGWANEDMAGSTASWTLSGELNFTEEGSFSAEHINGELDDDSQQDWLISPAIEVPAGSSLTLSFWSYNRWTSWYVKNSVRISSTHADPAQGNYIEIWSPPAVMEGWSRTELDLSPYAGQTIYMGFVYEGQDAHGWNLDEVTIE